MKTNRGITLIALIITIVLIIIVAGAIISLIDTNIIQQAETAVHRYNEAELRQKIDFVFTEAQISKYTDSQYSIEDNLKVIFEDIYGKDNIIVVKSGKNYKVKLKDSKITFIVKADGSLQEHKEMEPTSVYARLDDEGVLYLRATEKEGYNLYTNCNSIQSNWNTEGNATKESILKIKIEEEIAPTTLNSMFANFINLTSIESMQNLHTENVTDMYGVFYGCKSLTNIDITNFDTTKVKTFRSIFYGCNALLEIDLSGFETSNATSMYGMFVNCKNLKSLDLSNFNTANVKDMEKMFSGCYILESININSFDTKNIINMNMMFADCRSLTSVNVSNFDTTSVTNMSGMFANCHMLTKLDISNFNTSNVTNMKQMFAKSVVLDEIKLGSDFIITDNTDLTQILEGVPTDIKITALESTRDKLIEASSLTNMNFEIIN